MKLQPVGFLAVLIGACVPTGLLIAANHAATGTAGQLRFYALLVGLICGLVAAVVYFHAITSRIYWKTKETSELIANELGDSIGHLLDEIKADTRDDVDDLKTGNITRVHVFTALTPALGGVFLVAAIVWQKFSANWGPFNITLLAVIFSVLTVLVVRRTHWFRDLRFETPAKVFLIPTLTLVLCVPLGLYMTEPLEPGGESQYAMAQNRSTDVQPSDSYNNTRASHVIYSFSNTSSSSSTGSFASVFDDIDGDALLVIILAGLCLIFLIASAFVPGFWYFAGIVLLTILTMMVIREIRRRPNLRYQHVTPYYR